MTRKLLCLASLVIACHFVSGAEALDEEQFQKLMKEVGDTTKSFKSKIDNKEHALVHKDASRIAEIYRQMAGFWQHRQLEKPAKWSAESSAAAKALATSAQDQDWDKVKANVKDLMKNCKACHEAHREKLEDGTYRIKP